MHHWNAPLKCTTEIHHWNAPLKYTTEIHHWNAPLKCTTEMHYDACRWILWIIWILMIDSFVLVCHVICWDFSLVHTTRSQSYAWIAIILMRNYPHTLPPNPHSPFLPSPFFPFPFPSLPPLFFSSPFLPLSFSSFVDNSQSETDDGNIWR